MTTSQLAAPARADAAAPADTATAPRPGRYKWIALSSTTLGLLLATANSSIVLIALPDIFDGIKLDPLQPGNTSYLLWMVMGYFVVTAVLVVTSGRLGDLFGRARMYKIGLVIFTACSILLSVTWMTGDAAAWWLIGWRVAQGIGGALLMANSTAIVTGVFPARQRGTAIGINSVAAIAGSFSGLLLGGLLGSRNWHLVFAVSAAVGVLGTVWACLMLKETSARRAVKVDWWGNVTLAAGLIAVLAALTSAIQPYRGQATGWTSPWVLAGLTGGAVLLAVFAVIELTVSEPLLRLSLLRNRGFAFGTGANLLTSLGRGGLPFILLIWLLGVWLPQHGYSFSQAPWRAGLDLLPMAAGFLLSAPLAGTAAGRFGPRAFTVSGPLLTAAAFGLLMVIPADFSYWQLAPVLLLSGIGAGIFISPNRAEIMTYVPPDQRGAGAGMTATIMYAASAVSIGVLFSLTVAGMATSLPSALYDGLTRQDVPPAAAAAVARLPAPGVVFAAFLGGNPMRPLLGSLSGHMPAAKLNLITGQHFFPRLITHAFHHGLVVTFCFAIAVSVLAAAASALAGKPRPAARTPGTAPEVPDAVLEPTEAALEPPEAALAPPGAGLACGVAGEVTAAAPVNALQAGASSAIAGPVIVGTVTRPDGAPAAGVAVTALSAMSVVAGTAVTGSDGRYRLQVSAPGHYVLIAAGQRTREVRLDPRVAGDAPVLLTIGEPA